MNTDPICLCLFIAYGQIGDQKPIAKKRGGTEKPDE